MSSYSAVLCSIAIAAWLVGAAGYLVGKNSRPSLCEQRAEARAEQCRIEVLETCEAKP